MTGTEKLQTWHVPPRRIVKPSLSKNIAFAKVQYGKEHKATRKRLDDRVTLSLDEDALQELLVAVSRTCPKSGLLHFWDSDSEAEHEDEDMEIQEDTLSLDQEAQKMVIYEPGSEIPTLAQELEGMPPDSPYCREIIDEYMRSLTLTKELATYIETVTQQQKLNNLWLLLHNGRITSSIFGEIIHRKETTNADKLVQRIMGYIPFTYQSPAMKWGTDNESTAQSAYLLEKKSKGITATIQPSGLTLSTTHSFLGASGDGWVCEGGEKGILEVKTVFTIDSIDVTKIHPLQLAENPKCCLELHDAMPRLKRSHKYYYQVQGELAIMHVPWCDFVVWTTAGIFVERITPDRDLWNTAMLPKLTAFYMEHVVPEILFRRLQIISNL